MKRLTRAFLTACAVSATALTMAPPTANATVTTGPTVAQEAGNKRTLTQVRKATARFRLPAAAIRSGYAATSTCVDLPGVGAMGYHFVNRAHMADGVLDVRRPEMLVYVRTRHGLRLGAVEYFKVDADQKISTHTDRPSLFGRHFDGPMPGHEAGMPIHYDLHVWLYKHNPAGMFGTWNPAVKCPGSNHR
jgi:hypothetical protein